MVVLFFNDIVIYCNLTATKNDQLVFLFGYLPCKGGKIFWSNVTNPDAVTTIDDHHSIHL